MNKWNPRNYSIQELLRQFAEILDELKKRGVVRTRNNPVADYAEFLTINVLELNLERNSKSGYDATNIEGEKFQIKGRRLDRASGSRQLSVIRNLAKHEFNYLIGILFNHNFEIIEVYKIPHSLIGKYARFSEHQNGHILQLRSPITQEPSVENLTNIFTRYNRHN